MSATALGLDGMLTPEAATPVQPRPKNSMTFGSLLNAPATSQTPASQADVAQDHADTDDAHTHQEHSELQNELLASLLANTPSLPTTVATASVDEQSWLAGAVVATLSQQAPPPESTPAANGAPKVLAAVNPVPVAELGSWLATKCAPPAQSLSLSLAPAELGPVTVTVRWQNGALHIRIACTTATALMALQANAADLAQNLVASGYRVGHLTIVQQQSLGQRLGATEADDDNDTPPTATRVTARRGQRITRIV